MNNEHKQKLEIDNDKINIEIMPNYEEKYLRINLVYMDTGMIIQRDFSFDTTVRRLFASTIRTLKNRHPNYPEYQIPIIPKEQGK
jgi:hypothetical protein